MKKTFLESQTIIRPTIEEPIARQALQIFKRLSSTHPRMGQWDPSWDVELTTRSTVDGVELWGKLTVRGYYSYTILDLFRKKR